MSVRGMSEEMPSRNFLSSFRAECPDLRPEIRIVELTHKHTDKINFDWLYYYLLVILLRA